jgi:hypothetical protein
MIRNYVRRCITLTGLWLLSSHIAFAQDDWTQVFPNQMPLGRNFSAMAYDAARHQTVLFGGIVNNQQVLNDTWVWNGTNWIQKTPATSPGPRYGHAMVFDAARNEVVLFGGLGGSGCCGDTWVWDGTTWTERFPATAPPARHSSAMTYDPVHRQSVLFGGVGLSFPFFGELLDDTWVWDGNNWAERLPVNQPSPRTGHSMTFDANHDVVVLFGGRLGLFPSDMGDTWSWDGANWTQLFPSTSPPPTSGHTLVYDIVRSQVLLFGGYDNGAFSRNDTWTWNGAGWTRLFPATSPPARTNYGMAYDSDLLEVVLFSGASFPGADFGNFSDTWLFTDRLNVDAFLTFTPTVNTYRTIADTTGCPTTGFFGKFTFAASLVNKSVSSTISDATVRVATLTNGNLLLDPQTNSLSGGVGTIMPIPKQGQYADGVLSPSESVEVPFVICLKTFQTFQFFVDVFALKH